MSRYGRTGVSGRAKFVAGLLALLAIVLYFAVTAPVESAEAVVHVCGQLKTFIQTL